MKNRLAIIGIDSLDPYVLMKYRNELPTFSNLITNSETLISKSTFPVDSIPAWATIYTGLNPGNHGLLYSYDIFDPNLSDLHKLDSNSLKTHTFWDIAEINGYKSAIIFPMFMFPAWNINGVMVSKSPFDQKINDIQTKIFLDTSPSSIKLDYEIPENLMSIWGGYPGKKNLPKWADFGYEALNHEYAIAEKIFSKEKWDILHIYFSLLDIIQHRLWRFFDENDPTYSFDNQLSQIILNYYKLFDTFIKDFIEKFPDTSLMVVSDHGHSVRPMKTINVNEFLRQGGYLITKRKNSLFANKIKHIILEIITKFDLEYSVIKIVSSNGLITKKSKMMYSSKGMIDQQTIASLSSFVGIKSYSFGGIEINRNSISDSEYIKIRQTIIDTLSNLKSSDGKQLFNWVVKREDLYNHNPGKYHTQIFPDIVFELQRDYCVGWNLHSNLFEKSYDHKVASGGHSKDGVILLSNLNREVKTNVVSLVDITPSILDILDVDRKGYNFDGKTIF